MIIFPLLVLFSHFRIFRCSSFYTTIETIHPLSDLRKITIDPGSGDIFVGGTNVVLKLNSNFEKVAEFALGPKISSKYCRPYEIKTCPNATNLDNVVSILEFLPALNQTLLCGTLEYGNCSLLTENELRPLAHDEQNYLGSDQGSIFVPFKEDGTSVYFIGTSWDGRQQLMTEEFSFKTLYQMKFSHKTAFSRKGLCDKKRKISRLKFIYGFQDDDYVYTLYLMVRVDNSRNYYETKISKVCKKDKYFGSFQELILSCEGHNIATAAYYSNEKDLFVAFGTGNQSLTAQPSSIVCKYSAKEIKNRFETSYVQCYSDYSDKKGYTPPRWSSCDNGSVCKNSPTISVTSVCSSRSLYEIQGLENTEPWHSGHTVIYRDQKRLLTSVLTQTPIDGEHPFVWVGTSDGFLIKLGIQKSGSVVYSEYNLSENRQIGIEPDVEVDSGGQNAYFLHGNKVSKFPLNSCRIYSTCGACVLKRDPLGCGWCRDSCRRKEECNTTWHNSSCPPFIHKVTPSSGPTEGGTRLTVTGENFGWSNQSAPTVRVGKTQCENVSWNDTIIFCSLPSAGPHTGKVTVETIPQNSIRGYQMAGKSEIREFYFTFKVPVVLTMTPLFGPRHGNTILTIRGDNLDIGSDTFLSMCQIIRKNSTSIVCKTHECQDIHTGNKGLKDSKSCPFCEKNTLTIDNFKKDVSNESFCYRPNPVIEEISRNSTTTSGGLVFKITGKHFDSVQSYVFRTLVTPTIRTDTICTQSNGTEIICLTPDFSNTSTVTNSVQGILLLDKDDYFWNVRTRNRSFHLKVFKDPSFETVDRSLLTDVLQNSHHLELKGRNLQGLQPEDIRITIEGMDCPVVYVGSSMLRCDLSATIEKSQLLQEEMSFNLKISIGNMNMHLGQMAFSHQKKLNLAGNKTLIPTALTCVLLILLVMCIICMRKYRVGPFKRKIVHHEPQVVYFADNPGQQVSHRLMPETDPESSTSTKLNDYVRDFDGNLLDHVPYGTDNSVFADTVLVLEKQNLLIDGDCLRFDSDGSNIGRGNFGCVYKAFLRRPGQNYEMIVAVKTIIRSSDANVNAFLNEALIMKDFNHPNVLTLIGITLDKGEFPMVILPFMQNGSLLSYIRNENNMPTVKHLVTYGLHIALGMEYMAENKFVHRDLAARNCMLDVNFTVKVADFGLTRDVYSKEYYSSENKQRLPVKWMAPESLEQGKYSAKSDVWSYGVLLWELMTRGAIPYSVVDNWDVGAYIKSGRRLPRPEYCQPYLYRLMRFCWQETPDKRPTFTHLRMEIQKMLNIKDSGKIAGDTHVELDRCTNYHYMDEMSLARQRSLSSTKWSVSSEDAALL